MSAEIAAVKERPIIFSGPMVRAILDGRKTQTRRIVAPRQSKPKGIAPLTMEPWLIDGEQETYKDGRPLWAGKHPSYPHEAKWFACDYGQPGDCLWVREAAYIAPPDFGHPSDGNCRDYENRTRVVSWSASMDSDSVRCATDYGVKQTSPMLMPRWASRITLEVTAVRVERLGALTVADAVAEGMIIHPGDESGSAVEKFIRLWDAINGKRAPWSSNPWVWCISFKRVTP